MIQRISWVIAALLGSSMTASATGANDATRFGVGCDKQGISYEWGQAGHEALCGGVDVVYASPSADSAALDLLRADYTVIIVEDDVHLPLVAGHVVVNETDLHDPTFIALLRLGRKAGKTIAIVDAKQRDADRFASLFGEGAGANCEPTFGSRWIDLYGLQQSIARVPALESSYCLVGLDRLDYEGELTTRRWLRERFALTPPGPTMSESTSIADDDTNITDLANAIHCSFRDANDPAGQNRVVGQDVYVTGVRSFLNSQDIYYVQNELTYEQGSSTETSYGYNVTRFGATGVTNFGLGALSQPQPATQTAFVSSITNSTTTGLQTSVGFNGMGPTATVGTSVTFGRAVQLSIPPTQITNNSRDPLPEWNFTRQNTAGDFNPQTSWFWTVNWGDYADGGEGTTGRIQFTSEVSMFDDFVALNACATVPYPFSGILEVNAPTVTDFVDPTTGTAITSVPQQQQFKIVGTNLFNGLVTGVLLGGDALPEANYTVNVDSSITVTVPGNQDTGSNTVVVQQTFDNIERQSDASQSIEVTRN